jgi:uncharacterized membrane protein
MFGISGTAKADVTLCNKTGGLLQFAVAHPITTPYETNTIIGWTQLKNKKCVKAVAGRPDYSFPFYFLAADKDAIVYRPKGVDRGYNFCVTREAFERRGSWNKLQNDCPSDWFQMDFNYEEIPAGKNMTFTFN